MNRRHPFHSICPYFAMFPETFVEQQLLTHTAPGDLVFDPFCGRGTTVFESLLKDRPAAGSDINPVAACIASAKAAAPRLPAVAARIDSLEADFQLYSPDTAALPPFFDACFESETLREILFVRESLDWQADQVDCFLAAVMLGILHGESHRTASCLSNRMPRTISTKPDYSIRWWQERGLVPPRRPVFETLRKAVAFRYRLPPAKLTGIVKLADARTAASAFVEHTGKVKLVVTSPPYLDTTDYAEDQWLRLWFLGGKPFPELRKHKDDRHTHIDRYWDFLNQSWAGLAPLLAPRATIVIRIGGSKLAKKDMLEGLTSGLKVALNQHSVKPIGSGHTSDIRMREVSKFRSAPASTGVEHDFTFQVSRRRLPSGGEPPGELATTSN